MTSISPARADEILDALRRGTVPESSLDAFAVGLDPYRDTLTGELQQAATGRGRFKAVRGDYGAGKTFSPAGSRGSREAGVSRRPRSRCRRRKPRCIGLKRCTGA